MRLKKCPAWGVAYVPLVAYNLDQTELGQRIRDAVAANNVACVARTRLPSWRLPFTNGGHNIKNSWGT